MIRGHVDSNLLLLGHQGAVGVSDITTLDCHNKHYIRCVPTADPHYQYDNISTTELSPATRIVTDGRGFVHMSFAAYNQFIPHKMVGEVAFCIVLCLRNCH